MYLSLYVFFPPFSQSQEHARLTILHWNDFHAQNVPMKILGGSQHDSAYWVGGTATLLGYIDKYRHDRSDVVLLNAGDDFQGTPISTFTAGQSQIELMNRIAPDAATLGNHEFDYGMDSLTVNIHRAQFPILSANVVDRKTETSLGQLYLIKTFGSVTIGMIGLAPPDLGLLTFSKNLEGYRIRDVDSSVTIALKAMRTNNKHPNIIVVISHMGIGQDTLLAERRNDIDVIVGGHDHLTLFSPKKKHRTVIVQAGSKGQYLGKLDLDVDIVGDSLLGYNGELIETRVGTVAPDSETTNLVKHYETIVDERLGKVIGTLVIPWSRDGAANKKEINIGNFECDVMQNSLHTDIAFHNVGGIRKDLDAGPIRVRDIWEINPFGNTLVTFSVSGDTLLKMMEWQASVNAREFTQVSGLVYVYDSSRPTGHRLISVFINGSPLQSSRHYSICTNNYIGSHLKEFFGLDSHNIHVTDTEIVDRDVIIEYIMKVQRIVSRIEGRITDQAQNR
jgi:5'-nucleotidase/UDP-sugar diphosphatase